MIEKEKESHQRRVKDHQARVKKQRKQRKVIQVVLKMRKTIH